MRCHPDDVALKSFFLGPQAENADFVRQQMDTILDGWFEWRRNRFPEDGKAISEKDLNLPEFQEKREHFAQLLRDVCVRFESEVPKFSPRYIAHMFSEFSLPALLGHMLTLLHNPNNISGESSRVGTQLEDEAIGDLRQMVGYRQGGLTGHFCSGGTVANFESIVRSRFRLHRWLARASAAKVKGLWSGGLMEACHLGWDAWKELESGVSEAEESCWNFEHRNPYDLGRRLTELYGVPWLGPVLIVPASKHYSWEKAVSALGLPGDAFWPVDVTAEGRMSLSHLKIQLQRAEAAARPVLQVVTVVGTTEMGEVDPVHEVTAILKQEEKEKKRSIWHHVDAAYGGFLCTIFRDENGNPVENHGPLSRAVEQALLGIAETNSVTLDPHKLGYVPYSSGAFLVREAREYATSVVSCPYLDVGKSTDRGPFTLEGSRSAAGAVATWLSARCIGLHASGYGRILERTVLQKMKMESSLSRVPCVRIAPGTDTNIVCLTVARAGEPLTTTNARMKRLAEHFAPTGGAPFLVSRTTLAASKYESYVRSFCSQWGAVTDDDSIILMRLTLMNPFFDSRETRICYRDAFVEALQAQLAAMDGL